MLGGTIRLPGTSLFGSRDDTVLIDDGTTNRFRRARGRRLSQHIQKLRVDAGRDLEVLDLGGRADYWGNIDLSGIARVVIVNATSEELLRPAPDGPFEFAVGDARDLKEYQTGAFDLVHSNSVIEHVGLWPDMCRMSSECARVGSHGWVQTPAWEFPLEPHFRLPFVHWLGEPARRAALGLVGPYRGQSLAARRAHVDRINLLSHGEVRDLFPRADIWIERIAGLPKSYVAVW